MMGKASRTASGRHILPSDYKKGDGGRETPTPQMALIKESLYSSTGTHSSWLQIQAWGCSTEKKTRVGSSGPS